MSGNYQFAVMSGANYGWRDDEIMNTEHIRNIMLGAVETAKRKQIFEALNEAYDIVVACSERIGMTYDDNRKYFSGIADDYKMAKLRYEVAQERETEKL